MQIFLWALFYLLTPAIILYLATKFDHLSKLGVVVIAYVIGLLVGNIGVLPDTIGSLHEALTTFTVPLALPLIFFSIDLNSWRRHARPTFLSLLSAFVAVVVASAGAYLFFSPYVGAESWKVAGMLVGVYTGGTPNLAAIGTALKVDSLTYVTVHGSDVVVSGLLLLLFISIAPSVLRRILPAYRHNGGTHPEDFNFSPGSFALAPGAFRSMGASLGLAAAVFAAGGSFTLFLPETAALPAAILTITSLGVALSFIPSVRRLPYSFPLGHYLIIIFSLTVSSMADLRTLSIQAPLIMLYVVVLLLTIILLHLLLSRLLHIDADTHLITTTSFILSPPFVPVVAAALGNREVIVSGMITGITGWIAGNYLGIALAYILRAL
ncbi:MAG: DUF819 family protein [Spirochaetia bacterium]